MTSNKKRIRVLCGTLAVLVPVLTTGVAAAEPSTRPSNEATTPDDNARVRGLFHDGEVAYQTGKYEEARQLFLEAWSVRPTYDVASSLAQVELKLQRFRDAAEHLQYCLEHFAPSESATILEHVQKALADAKTRVAMVRVSSNRDGAEVFVDSIRVGVAPVESALFVDPGKRHVSARFNGQSTEEFVNAEAGKEYAAALTFGDETGKPATTVIAPVPPAGSNAVAAPTAQPRSYVPAMVTASVGGVALATGVVLILEAAHKDTRWHNQLSELPGTNQCAAQNPNAAACDEISSLAKDAKTFRALSITGFGVAAVAGLATYFLWPRRSDKIALGLRVMVLPGRAGVDIFTGLDGSF